jgi:PAS domain S-box-containing protein
MQLVLKKLLLLLILILIYNTLLKAGQQGYFELSGLILKGNQKAIGAVVRVYLHSQKIDSFVTISDGRFRMKIDLNRDYIIEFYKVGYISKKVALSTKIPKGREGERWAYNTVVQLIEQPVGFQPSNQPVAKIQFSYKNNGAFEEDGYYAQIAQENQKQQETKIENRNSQLAKVQQEIDKLSPEAKQTLGFHIRQRQVQVEASEIMAKAYEALYLANEQAKQIVENARYGSAADTAFYPSKKRKENKMFEGVSEVDLRTLAVNQEQFFKRKDIRQKEKVLNELEKRQSRSSQDSMLLLENNLFIKSELIKSARYQLEIDRLTAKTKEDSIQIRERSARIGAAEQEILLAKQELENSKNKIKLQEYRIQIQRISLYGTIFGMLLLFAFLFILYRNIRSKKKINLLLEEQNHELEKLSLVASKTDNAVLIADATGKIEWINAGFTRLFGYNYNELVSNIGDNMANVFTTPEIRKLLNICITNKRSVAYEFHAISKNGRKVWVHSNVTPYLDKAGNVTKLIAVDTDISQNKTYETEIIFQKNQIEQQNEQMKGSIRYAKTIQQAILPNLQVIKDRFDCFSIYRAKDIVSGDLFWHSRVKDLATDKELDFFAVVDCTGHGVPGAFMSMIGNRLLNEIVIEKEIIDPAIVLQRLNQAIIKALKQEETDNHDGMDVCLCRIAEGANGNFDVVYAGAKLSLYYYNSSSKEVVEVKADRSSIGGIRKKVKDIEFSNKQLELKKGDHLYMLTDGLIDQNNAERKRFGTPRLLQLLNRNAHLPLSIQHEIIETELDMFKKGEEQRDDITLLGLKLI